MGESKKRVKAPKMGLDTLIPKRPVGRPWRVSASEVAGRSYNFRLKFGQIWDSIGRSLIQAQTEDDVLKPIALAGQSYLNEFSPSRIAALILEIVHDPKFPKKRRGAQINFLADSLAAWGRVSPRRSRDICERERREEKRAHHIIRHEYYIECSCGYSGPALDSACRNCGAEIHSLSQSPLSAAGLRP